MAVLTLADMKKIISAISKTMEAEEEELCKMDAEMGDGDLGITMRKGWAAAAEVALISDETDFGKLLVKCGMKISSTVPSTMGTLMAAGLMSGGKAVSGKHCLDIKGLSDFLHGFCDGIRLRGKSQPGDRTVLDSLWPAAEAAGKQSDISTATAQVLNKAAWEGLEATKLMKPKFGKAVVFSEKAIGKIDQGAYVGFLLIKDLANYIQTL
jgi:dihydroxyacetone kinase-like protein